MEWLGRHPKVKRWIAIDDMDLASRLTPCGHLLCGHFVHTHRDKGLVPCDVDLALKLLGCGGSVEDAQEVPVEGGCGSSADGGREGSEGGGREGSRDGHGSS